MAKFCLAHPIGRPPFGRSLGSRTAKRWQRVHVVTLANAKVRWKLPFLRGIVAFWQYFDLLAVHFLLIDLLWEIATFRRIQLLSCQARAHSITGLDCRVFIRSLLQVRVSLICCTMVRTMILPEDPRFMHGSALLCIRGIVWQTGSV